MSLLKILLLLSFTLLSPQFAWSDGNKPFFTEYQVHGGILFNPGIGYGPKMGGTFSTGVDMGTAGIEFNSRVNYSSPIVGSTLPFIVQLIISARARLFSGKWAFKIGPAWAASTLITGGAPASLISNWGIGPSLAIHYLSSLDQRFYAGYGLDFNGVVLVQSGLSLAQRFLMDASFTLYFGTRLAFIGR